MYLLRVAHLYGKVLLFQWDNPEPVETFLEPARVDWSTHSGGLGEFVTQLLLDNGMKRLSPFDGRYHEDKGHPMLQLLRNGTAAMRFRAVQVRQAFLMQHCMWRLFQCQSLCLCQAVINVAELFWSSLLAVRRSWLQMVRVQSFDLPRAELYGDPEVQGQVAATWRHVPYHRLMAA
jgi:hypothetical protein